MSLMNKCETFCKKHEYVSYTILFVIASISVFYVFLATGRTLVTFGDGFNSYLPIFIYSGNYLRKLIPTIISKGRIPIYDFSIGFGDDIPGTLSWGGFGSPFTLISVLVPTRFAAYGLSLTIIFQYYVAGLTFLLFCKKMNIRKETAVCSALAYAFCGYGLYWGSYFYVFSIAMIYLPLFVLGIYRQIVNRGKIDLIFTVSVFLLSLSGFYFLYMSSIFGLIYYCGLFLTIRTKKKLKLKDFFSDAFRLVLKYIVGVFMASLIMMPTLYSYFHSVRFNSSGNVCDYFRGGYSLPYIKSQLSMIIMPNYVIGLGLNIITVICIILMFRRKHEFTLLKIMVFILGAGCFIQAFGSMMNGFSYPSTRWTYIFYFVAIYVTARIIDDNQVIDFKDVIFVVIGVFICLFLYLLFHDKTDVEKYRDVTIRVIIYGIIAIVTVFLVVKCKTYRNEAEFEQSVSRHYRFLLGMWVVNIIVSATMFFANMPGGYCISQLFRGNAIWDINNSNAAPVSKQKVNNNEFSRLDVYDSSLDQSLINNSNTTTSYYSMSNGYIYDLYLNALISPGVRGAKYVIKGLDARKSLEMLTSVRSFAEDEKGTEINHIDNVLPLGFAFRRSIYSDKAAKLSPLTISDMMSDTLVINVDKGSNDNDDYINGTDVAVKNRDIDVPCIVSTSGVLWKKEKLKSSKGGKITCTPQLSTLDKNKKYELYVLLKNFDCNDDYMVTNIEITGKSIQLRGKNSAFTLDSEDYLIKLNCNGDFDIVFPDEGDFTLDSISVKAIDITDYDQRFKILSQDTLQNMDIGVNQIKGTINAGEDEWLFFSIPYSEGWKCSVDGIKTRVLRADYAFSAIPLNKGNHSIVMSYEPPYLLPAILMFIVGWIAFISMVIRSRHDKI